jgi:hypothetical protein
MRKDRTKTQPTRRAPQNRPAPAGRQLSGGPWIGRIGKR